MRKRGKSYLSPNLLQSQFKVHFSGIYYRSKPILLDLVHDIATNLILSLIFAIPVTNEFDYTKCLFYVSLIWVTCWCSLLHNWILLPISGTLHFFNKLEVKLYQAEQSLSGTSYGITTTKVLKNITHQQNMCLPKRERSKEAKLPSIWK